MSPEELTERLEQSRLSTRELGSVDIHRIQTKKPAMATNEA